MQLLRLFMKKSLKPRKNIPSLSKIFKIAGRKSGERWNMRKKKKDKRLRK